MLTINNVYLQYGDRVVLDRVSFTLQEGERVGLVGVNGAGKSTTLKIIAGYLSPHEGNVTMPKGATLGFLHQDMNIPKGKTVIQETMTAFEEAKRIELRLQEIQHELEVRTDYESEAYEQLLIEFSELGERFHVLGGHGMQAEAEKILMGLGFKTADFERLTETFSGGWQMRIELAKMLLQRPNYLLLDEPTNHLDIESIIWLEQFLQGYPGCVVLISHDRTFLDNITKRTVEIDLGKVHDYKANYTKYLELRADRQTKLMASYENQQKEIARKEALIDKFRAKASKATMAQSLMKELGRMDRIELDHGNNAVMRLRFQPAPRSGEVVVGVNNLSKSYGEKEVLKDVDLQIIRGDRVSFVGKNGEGKSTLSKIIVGQLAYEKGGVELGHNVHLGYYAQNQADVLDPKLTVLETIDKVSPFEMRTKLRTILGAFLFSGEDVDKKVSVLSGGERARLAMACLLLRPINLLILDEPTNHLDMRSKEVLKEALMNYDGTLIVVSHDRDFLTGLTDTTIEFNNKHIRTHLGDIQYFLEKRAFDSLREVSLGKKSEREAEVKASNAPAKDEAALKKQERLVQQTEKRLQQLEKELKDLEAKLGDMSIFGKPEYQKLLSSHQAKKTEVQEAEAAWEEAYLVFEALKA